MSGMLSGWQLLSCLLTLFILYQKYHSLAEPYQREQEWVSTKQQFQKNQTDIHEDGGIVAFLAQNPLAFLAALWGSSICMRLLLVALVYGSLYLLYHSTKLPRNVSLAHWAGATLAHRGYRSEAQQMNNLIQPPMMMSSRRSSRADISATDDAAAPPNLGRRASRDEVSVHPTIAAAAALAAATHGGTPRATPRSLGAGLPPLPDGTIRSRANSRAASNGLIDYRNYNIPENSMLGFIYAHEHGVHGVEVDVALTKDGHIIVMHDNSFDRTMDGTGEVADRTLAEVMQMKYRKITNQEYVPREARNRLIDCTKVPTLEQVIIFCKERNLKLMIETKEYHDHNLLRKKIVGLYDKYDMYSWSFVATFNPWHLYWYRREYPNVPTCLLYCRTCTEWYHQDASKEMLLPGWLNYSPIRMTADWLLWYFSPTFIADWMGVAMVGPHNILISPALITSLTTRGIVCDVWTVNSELEKSWLKSLGCIVTSDFLFTHADPSPFTEKEAAPSIHAAEEFVQQSYYISNSQHITPPVPGTPTIAFGDELPVVSDHSTSGDEDTPSPVIGEGSVDMLHLRSESVDNFTLISPATLASAQDRIAKFSSPSPSPPSAPDSSAHTDAIHDVEDEVVDTNSSSTTQRKKTQRAE